MSFGSIAAMALLTIAILTLIVAVIHAGVLSIYKTEELLYEQMKIMDERLKTEIAIESIVFDPLDPSIVYVNVTNAGSSSINIASFNKADVVVTYISTTNVKIIKRLKYDPSKTGLDIWYINRVLVDDREGDIVNPIDLDSHHGLWDPGETLELTLKLSVAADPTQGMSVVMALPNGVSTMLSV